MVKKADVVVENFRPDVKKRLGIDYKDLRKINPRIVYASISGFGQTGPYAERPGFDQIAQGMGGLMSITGLPGQGPVRVGIPIADLSAGLFCATGHHGCAARTRKIRQGPACGDLAAAGADLHARLPGGALADEGRGGQAGRQQSSHQHSDRRVQDRRRLHQYRHYRPEDLGALLPGDGSAGLDAAAGIRKRRDALEEPRRAQRRDRSIHCQAHQRRLGRTLQQGGRAVRPDLRHRPDVRRSRRSSMSASRSRSRPRTRRR